MAKNIIIGIGNPLRGDDAFGFEVVNQFNEKNNQDPEIDCFHVQQLGLELLPYFEDCELLIFVDASIKLEEGILKKEIMEPGTFKENPVSHFFDPETLLSSTYALYGRHPKTILITVGARDFEIREGLTDLIKAKLPEAISLIENTIRE